MADRTGLSGHGLQQSTVPEASGDRALHLSSAVGAWWDGGVVFAVGAAPVSAVHAPAVFAVVDEDDPLWREEGWWSGLDEGAVEIPPPGPEDDEGPHPAERRGRLQERMHFKGRGNCRCPGHLRVC